MPALPHTRSLLWRASEEAGTNAARCICMIGEMHYMCGLYMKTGWLPEAPVLTEPLIQRWTQCL